MTQYDLLVLSAHEFENLTRDVLQKKLNHYIESFKTGKDNGIDLRYTCDQSQKTIIQAKRYQDYSALYIQLKKEAAKVISLNPNRYILSTSVGLSPKNKEDIKNLFKPYILDTEDIIGKDDLLNLLGIYSDIELKYYKLWLSSTVVLQRLIHSKAYNQSVFELEEINSEIKLYVQNDSFDKALTILKEHRYVIISGIPGIGKTTLSRMLVLFLLSNGYKEFVYITNIDEGLSLISEGKSQVFFFDDFLGKNFFDKKNTQNSDNRIVKFINKIQRTKDKVLIFATREYILKQAKHTFESFRINNIEIAKCTLDLSSYTNLIKAQILYNHIFFANIPKEYISDMLEKRNYLNLIHHPNYNPRIIETIIKGKVWKDCIPQGFTKYLSSFFDNPESVWLYAFENSLDNISQFALLVLSTMGLPVSVENWEEAVKEFFRVNYNKYQLGFDPIKFIRTIRELENTFIKTQKDIKDIIAVEFQNPSVRDFLVSYLRNKREIIKSLLVAIKFSDQIFTLFTTEKELEEKNVSIASSDLVSLIVNRILSIHKQLRSARLSKASFTKGDSFIWSNDNHHFYNFLLNVYEQFSNYNETIKDFVHKEFQKHILIKTSSYSEQVAFLKLLKELDRNKLDINEQKVIDSFLNYCYWLDNLELAHKFEEIFPTTYNNLITTESFYIDVKSIISREIKEVDDASLSDLKHQVSGLWDLYKLDFDTEISEIEIKEQEYDRQNGYDYDDYWERAQDFREIPNIESEDKIIGEIFTSLMDNDDRCQIE